MPASVFASLLNAAPDVRHTSRKHRVLERMRRGNQDVLMAVELFTSAESILEQKTKAEWTSRYHECNELRQLVEDASDELDSKGVNVVAEKYMSAAAQLYNYSQVAVAKAKAEKIAGPSNITLSSRGAGATPTAGKTFLQPFPPHSFNAVTSHPKYPTLAIPKSSPASCGIYNIHSPQFDAFAMIAPGAYRPGAADSPRQELRSPASSHERPVDAVMTPPKTRTLRSFKRNRAHSSPAMTSPGLQKSPSSATDKNTRSTRSGSRAHRDQDCENSLNTIPRRRPRELRRTWATNAALDRDSQLPPTPTIRDQFRTDGLASRVRPAPSHNLLREDDMYDQRVRPAVSPVDSLWI